MIMPSPVGHSMIGLGVGILYAWPRGATFRSFPEWVKRHRLPLFLAILFANLPDIDYVPGILTGDLNAYHHQFTHTLGWIVLVAAGTWTIWKAYHPTVGAKEAVFILACLAGHLVADWLTDDSSYPFGIMMWWPFSSAYTMAPQHIFPRPMKEDWGEVFDWHNVWVVWMEFLITAPLVLVVLIVKRFSNKRFPASLR